MYHTRECSYIGHCHCKPLPTPHRVFLQCNKNTGLHSPIHRNLVQYLHLELGVIHAKFFQLKLPIVPIYRIFDAKRIHHRSTSTIRYRLIFQPSNFVQQSAGKSKIVISDLLLIFQPRTIKALDFNYSDNK